MSQPCPPQDDKYDSEAFKALRQAPDRLNQEQCQQCGEWSNFAKHNYYCEACLPIQEHNARAWFRLHGDGRRSAAWYMKQDGDRLVVDAEALEQDKSNEEN